MKPNLIAKSLTTRMKPSDSSPIKNFNLDKSGGNANQTIVHLRSNSAQKSLLA